MPSFPRKPRVMLDVNIFIVGAIWPRWQYEILQHAVKGDYILVVAPLIIESAIRNIHAIAPAQVPRFERFLDDCDYELVTDPTREEVQEHIDLVRDVKDVPIAIAAMNAKVDYFVTYDRDFTNQDDTTEKVRQAIRGITLPPVFLRDVMGWSSEELEAIRERDWED